MKFSTKRARTATAAVCCMTLAASCFTLGYGLVASAAESYTVNTAVAAKKALYETTDSPELIKNGDFTIGSDVANPDDRWLVEGAAWKQQSWGEIDMSKQGKITYAWLKGDWDGLPIGDRKSVV